MIPDRAEAAALRCLRPYQALHRIEELVRQAGEHWLLASSIGCNGRIGETDWFHLDPSSRRLQVSSFFRPSLQARAPAMLFASLCNSEEKARVCRWLTQNLLTAGEQLGILVYDHVLVFGIDRPADSSASISSFRQISLR